MLSLLSKRFIRVCKPFYSRHNLINTFEVVEFLKFYSENSEKAEKTCTHYNENLF